MKLSDKDREVITYLYFHGDSSIEDIAKATGYRGPTIRHIIQKLKDHEVIFLSPFLNPYALGFIEYQLFFSLATPGEEARKQFINTLVGLDRVVWVGCLGGELQLDVIIYVKHVHELESFFDELSEKAAGIDYQKTMAVTTAMHYFPPKYLGGKKYSPSYLTCGQVKETHTIDETDHRVLAGLMDSDFKSLRQIARDLGMPASSLYYRLDVLKKKGVILGFGYQIDTYKSGTSAHLLLLEMKKVTPAIRQKLFKYGKDHKNVTYIIENMGAWDFQVGFRAIDSREISPIVQEFHKVLDQAVTRITPIPVCEIIKLDVYPFKSYSPDGNSDKT